MATNILVSGQLSPLSSLFPVVDINDVKGGLHYASTYDDLTKIKSGKRVDGMLGFVISEQTMYLYHQDTNTWDVWKVSGGNGILIVTSELLNNTSPIDNPDLYDPENVSEGQLIYNTTDNTYYQAHYDGNTIVWSPIIQGLNTERGLFSGTTDDITESEGNLLFNKEFIKEGSLFYNTEDDTYYQALYNGDTIVWSTDIKGLDLLLKYKCTDPNIPSNEITDYHNLAGLSRSEIEEMSYNEILTTLLFNEGMPFINEPAPLQYKDVYIEVGSTMSQDTTFELKTSEVLGNTGYIKDTSGGTKYAIKDIIWIESDKNISENPVIFGKNDNYASVINILSDNWSTLYSSYGRTLDELIAQHKILNKINLNDSESVCPVNVYGYYGIYCLLTTHPLDIEPSLYTGVRNVSPVKDNKVIKLTSYTSKYEVTIKTTDLYSYVYLFLPFYDTTNSTNIGVNITSAEVYGTLSLSWNSDIYEIAHPVETLYYDLSDLKTPTDSTKVSNDIISPDDMKTIVKKFFNISSFSTNYTYYIVKIPKALYNADITVSPNDEKVRVLFAHMDPSGFPSFPSVGE